LYGKKITAINEDVFSCTEVDLFDLLAWLHGFVPTESTLMPLPAIYPLSPLGLVLNDIQRAVEAKLYYPALLVALTIPEICVALTMEKKDLVKGKHYVAFIDKYTIPRELGLSGIDCYRLRGGVVHRANFSGHPKVDWTNVVFTVPETGSQIHALSMRTADKIAAMFSLEMFCGSMIAAANKWYKENKNNPKVSQNMNDLIRWCPNGLSPFVGGAPVVASGP
jgi:hypothetical protein